MHRGYVKLWRKTIDSGLLTNPNAFTLFAYFLMRASYTNQEIVRKSQVIKLGKGDVLTSLERIGLDTGLTSQKARTALKFLKKLSLIEEKVTNKYRVVSIVKWGIYQQEGEEDNKQTNKQLTSRQQATNNQDNNIEERKELKEGEERINKTVSAKKKLQNKIFDESFPVILSIWTEICKQYGLSARTGGKACEKLARDYIKTEDDAKRAIKGFSGFIANEPADFYTSNPQVWKLEWFFRKQGSGKNPVDRIQDLVDGVYFKKNQREENKKKDNGSFITDYIEEYGMDF